MKFDLDKFGTPSVFKWNHEQMVRVLTTGHNRIVKNPRLVRALKEIKREDFLPEDLAHDAYLDKELEIGFGQKTSKPTTTAYLLELLNPKVSSRVLNIGTGSGWSTALISFMIGNTGTVITVEKYQYIADFARNNLKKYPQLKNIEVIFKDGYNGIAERAPYDFIYASSVYDDIPNSLKEQLNIGGKMIVPIENYSIALIERETKDKWNEKFFHSVILERMEKGVV